MGRLLSSGRESIRVNLCRGTIYILFILLILLDLCRWCVSDGNFSNGDSGFPCRARRGYDTTGGLFL